MGQLIQELKRRNVIRVAVPYAVAAWLLIEVTSTIFPILSVPAWSVTLVTVLLLIGFPLVLVFSWAYEITPEGIKKEKDVDRSESITRETAKKLDIAVIVLVILAIGTVIGNRLVPDATTPAAEPIADTAVSTSVSDQSIAVLPFADLSPEGDQEYFSDGISEEILNLLAKVPGMRVTSRSSAFSFRGQNLDIPTMAARLNVAHILEGSVRKSGMQLRITTQLVEAKTDTHLWSKTYDRKLEDVFAIQDEIAAAVVDALKITLLGEEPKAAEANPEAYTLYLQGRHFNNQLTAESNKQAETLLKQALEGDPSFAPAWTELGRVYERQAGDFGIRSIDEGNELARDAIQQALAIDPQNGRAYAVLAEIEMWYDWDFTAAAQHVQQALSLNPGDAAILRSAAVLNRILGRLDEAIDLQRQSIALDPVSPDGHHRLGLILYRANRLDEAADSFQMALSLTVGRISSQYRLGRVLLAQGDAPAALVAMEQETSDGYRLTGTAVVQHALGDAAASDAALRELIEKYAAPMAYQIAEVYAFRGENDQAFDWLEQAYDNRDSGLTNMLTSPLLANLHDDPRWIPFLDKMGLPH